MRWPGACLLAWSFAVPAAGQVDGAPVAPPPPAEGTEPAGPGVRWVLPPVVWSGSVMYDLRLDHTHGQPRTTEHLLSTTLNAVTYIYAPWFALVSGSVGVTLGRISGDPPAPTSDDSFTTGALRLNLFPRSRFPFEARYEVSDSRTDSSLGGGVDYRSRQLVLTQRYRPAGGEFNFSTSYERRAQEGPTFGEDTQEALLADFSTRYKRHNLALSASRALNRRHQTDEETDFRTAVARHTYVQGTELSVETGLNWARTDDQLLSGTTWQALAQWSTVALYRPEGQGLTVTGSVRSFLIEASQQARTGTLSAGLGVGYEVSRNLRLALTFSATTTDGETLAASVASIGATYQGDTLRLGNYNYDWNVGGALSNSRSRDAEENTVSTQLGHTLSRVWALDASSNVTANVGQTLSSSYSRGDSEGPGHPLGLSRALTQTAGLTWSSSGLDRYAFARASFSDSRQFDAERARYQLLNLQLSGNYEIDRFRGWSGDLTLQRVFQRSLSFQSPTTTTTTSPDLFSFDRTITHTASGEVTYRETRVFGVPRLRFQSRLRLARDSHYLSSALITLPDRETLSWENRLDYQIGRLDTSATLRIAKTDGLWRELLALRVVRNF